MNHRRGRTRAAFAAIALLLLGAMGVVTWRVLDLESRRREADILAQRRDRIRLALWRMDSALAPLLIREASRPYFEYVAFYPAGRAYTRMLRPVDPGEVLVPSPLLAGPPPMCRLHFQFEPGAAGQAERLLSPQAPTGNQRDLAESQYVASASLIAAAGELDDLRGFLGFAELTKAAAGGWNRSRANEPDAQSFDPDTPNQPVARQQVGADERPGQSGSPPDAYQRDEALGDAAARERILQSAKQAQSEANSYAQQVWTAKDGVQRSEVEIGNMVATWARRPGAGPEAPPRLLLVRPVRVESAQLIQGVWLDWEALQAQLLDVVADLAPGASLSPAPDASASAQGIDAGVMLAGLPVAFTPGAMDTGPAPGSLTPARITLMIAWIAVLIGASAMWLVVRALEEIGERRGRFVSAVTHELRTPLTAFRLYSQMLADGMVTDEATQREYHATLKTESARLARIVENVLAYARLTDLRSVPRVERISGNDLLREVAPTLRERARECDAELALDPGPEAGGPGDTLVDVDRQTVERVLINLVDNACKYAASVAEDRRIHVLLERSGAGSGAMNGNDLAIVVADHGPGVARADEPTLFRPFRRGAHGRRDTEGVGLGLALARDLLREIGGDLRLERRPGFGGVFVVTIPRSA